MSLVDRKLILDRISLYNRRKIIWKKSLLVYIIEGKIFLDKLNFMLYYLLVVVVKSFKEEPKMKVEVVKSIFMTKDDGSRYVYVNGREKIYIDSRGKVYTLQSDGDVIDWHEVAAI